MKDKEEIILTDNNQNKNLLNSLISYNNNKNNFNKINSSNIIINTSGSHPIINFKKILNSFAPTFVNNKKKKENKPLKQNYINDDSLKKKINNYNSFLKQ